MRWSRANIHVEHMVHVEVYQTHDTYIKSVC